MTPQEIYIPVNSQELADELKEICLKYGLPIWESNTSFIWTRFDKYFRMTNGKFNISHLPTKPKLTKSNSLSCLIILIIKT